MTGMLVVAVIFSSMVQLVNEFGEVREQTDFPRLDYSGGLGGLFARWLVSGDAEVFRQAGRDTRQDGQD